MAGVDFRRSRDFTLFTSWFYAWVQNVITDGRWDLYYTWVQLLHFTCRVLRPRGDEWSLRAFASMPSTAIFCEHEQKLKICFASLRATQKFGEHEQASTRLNFASKSSKGKILRAVKNFNGPFITPRPPSAKLRQWWPSREQATKNCGLANLSSVWMPRWRIFRQFSLRFKARLLSVSLIVDPPERASRHTSSTQLCTIRGRPENEVVRRVNLVPRAFTRLPSRSLIFCYISMNGMLLFSINFTKSKNPG